MTLTRFLGRLVCFVKRKHARGRRLTHPDFTTSVHNEQWYQCPRCGAQWTRKVRQRKPKEVA